jgi:hypothetical protein
MFRTFDAQTGQIVSRRAVFEPPEQPYQMVCMNSQPIDFFGQPFRVIKIPSIGLFHRVHLFTLRLKFHQIRPAFSAWPETRSHRLVCVSKKLYILL